MFGFGLKSKTEKVIKDHFHYFVSRMKRPVFNALVKQGKSVGQNEYSIAIFYMMVMMNSLLEAWADGDESRRKEVGDFIMLHGKNIARIMHLANSPESDIEEMLQEIIVKSGMANPDDRPVEVVMNREGLSKHSEERTEESEEIEKTEQPDEDDLDMKRLRNAGNLYIKYLKSISPHIPSVTNAKMLSDFQIKFIYALKILGAMDVTRRSLKIDEQKCLDSLFEHYNNPDLFGWSPDEAEAVFNLAMNAQGEEWAEKIIVGGGNAYAYIVKNAHKDKKDLEVSEREHFLPSIHIFEDKELMKLVAKNVQPPF